MAEQVYLTAKEAAKFLTLSEHTLRNWRVEGKGPGFHKLGSRVVYARVDLEAWADQQYRNSTSEGGI
jgi:excisionase family DNA binding protein